MQGSESKQGSESSSENMVPPMPKDFTLPVGWVCEKVLIKSGANSGLSRKTYFNPDEPRPLRLPSLPAVWRHLHMSKVERKNRSHMVSRLTKRDLSPSPSAPPSPRLGRLDALRMPVFSCDFHENAVEAACRYLGVLNIRFMELNLLYPELTAYFESSSKTQALYSGLPAFITEKLSYRLFVFLFPEVEHKESFGLVDLGCLQFPLLLASAGVLLHDNAAPPAKRPKL